MSQHFLPGDPEIPLVLRQSARARRISLRVSQLDGRVTLTLPKHVSVREALAFAREKEAWIRKHLDARSEDVAVGVGTRIPIGGRLIEVAAGSGRQTIVDKEMIYVPGAPDQVGKRLAGYLKTIARNRLAEAVDDYTSLLGKQHTAITLRDTRSRWGSCTTQGRLMFSWRLIMAPPEILDYVAAHEVAHLKQMNHSAAFWGEVARIYGPYEKPRRWLRKHGNELHRYKFDGAT